MKKIILLVLALTMVMCIAACGKKSGDSSAADSKAGGETSSVKQEETAAESNKAAEAAEPDNNKAAETTEQETTEEEFPEGDPVEYGQDFWAKKYPDANICPFSIEVGGKEYPYYWISSLVGEDDIAAWAATPLNWNGWHMVGDKLVDKDEKHAITDESREMSFSSCCVYKTEPFDASKASSANGDEAAVSTAYNFKGYTETADWPGEDCWTSFGLPVLPMGDDVNGTVHISDREWIYPLNGSDGIMFEAHPASSQIEEIINVLIDGGIAMEKDEDTENSYTAYYQNGGSEMKITVSESDSGKITVTIITGPTD